MTFQSLWLTWYDDNWGEYVWQLGCSQVRSPDDEEGDDLFSDCRSEAGEGPASVAGEPTTTKPTTTTTPSIRERLNLGMHNNGQEEELLVVAVADPHKVRDNIVLVNPSSSFLQIVVVIVCAINDKRQGG